jgi:hypothetical protein
MGDYDYRDEAAHAASLGRDLLTTLSLILAGKILGREGTGASIKEFLDSKKLMQGFMIGSSVGGFQDKLADIGSSLSSFGANMSPMIVETIVATGSATRWDYERETEDDRF